MALRLGAVALIAWALWLAVRPVVAPVHHARIAQGDLAERLRDWARDGAPDAVHVAVDSLPDDSLLDWLVALRRTGTPVSWSGEIAPLAVAVEPVNAPAGGARVLVAAPAESSVALSDAAGPLDTVLAGPAGASLRVPAVAEPAVARLGPTTATANLGDTVAAGAVLVLATAGWEARYVTSALEESGWQVDARLTIAPGLSIRRGGPGTIDTSRYAAVVALDSAAAGDARRLAAFVRDGGGVVLGGIAARLPALRELAPGTPGARVRPATASFTSAAPRQALGFFAIDRLRSDAVVLERRGAAATLAARRAGAGRVLQIGYDETWRWRMQGGAGGLDAHRRWWSDAIAATALRRHVETGLPHDVREAAPRAALFDAFGPPVAAPGDARRASASPALRPWMLVLALLLLLAEWTSRRLRGAA